MSITQSIRSEKKSTYAEDTDACADGTENGCSPYHLNSSLVLCWRSDRRGRRPVCGPTAQSVH